VAPNTGSAGYHVVALGTNANSGFPGRLSVSQVADDAQAGAGKVILGAAVCLADNVPVTGSLNVRLLTINNSKIIRDTLDSHIPASIKAHLAEIACNSTR
jgi:hypothetical protein